MYGLRDRGMEHIEFVDGRNRAGRSFRDVLFSCDRADKEGWEKKIDSPNYHYLFLYNFLTINSN